MSNEPTNDELVSDPAQTLRLIAQGQGHYARLICAAFVSDAPETADRMSEMLRNPGEAVSITSTLRAGVMHTQVHLHLEGHHRPRLIGERADTLPAIGQPAAH